MNATNLRFSSWLKAMKKSGIVKSQKSLGEIIRNEDGKAMSQAFISVMAAGDSNVSRHTIEAIEANFPFTTEHYFVTGVDAMVDMHKLMQWVLQRHGKTQKWLAEETGIPQPELSKMNNRQELINDWQSVFDVLNKFGYKISSKYLMTQHLGEDKEFTGKSEHVERLFEFYNYLKAYRKISSRREFCEKIGAPVTEQIVSNMLSERYQQDLTKNMAVAVLKAFPQLSSDWLLLGTGDMLRNPGSVHSVMFEINQKLDNLLAKSEES